MPPYSHESNSRPPSTFTMAGGEGGGAYCTCRGMQFACGEGALACPIARVPEALGRHGGGGDLGPCVGWVGGWERGQEGRLLVRVG
jgi:hypothetical protein